MFLHLSVILFKGRVCTAGGHVWQEVGGGRLWQERRPLQRTVRILLECILVKIHCFPLQIRYLSFICISLSTQFRNLNIILFVHLCFSCRNDFGSVNLLCVIMDYLAICRHCREKPRNQNNFNLRHQVEKKMNFS